MKDHYQVLGLTPTATAEEVKAAGRREQLRWHPDRCKLPEAEQRFRQVTAALEVLGDPAARARYDLERAVSPDAVQTMARQHLGRDLTPRERAGIRWLAFAARLARR